MHQVVLGSTRYNMHQVHFGSKRRGVRARVIMVSGIRCRDEPNIDRGLMLNMLKNIKQLGGFDRGLL